MARLPIPGSDADVWASILNDYLLVAHNNNGTLRNSTVAKDAIKTTNTGNAGQVLSTDGNNLAWTTTSTGGIQNVIPINVTDFGAKGDGITDDTAAVQAAIDAAPKGAGIIFPRGTYMVTGLKIKRSSMTLSGLSRGGSRIMRLSGTDPLIDMSGTSSMNGHIRYCSITDIMISGNGLPGTLVRSYYADNLIFTEVNFVNCADTAVDFVEVWDSSFSDCAWENCGSADAPAFLMRNSTGLGNFGYSQDSTNQIHFHNCRWEGFRNGAVAIDGGANGSTTLLNGIFFVSCKMESSVLMGPAMQIRTGCTIIFSDQMYIAMMARGDGYTDAVDAIADGGNHVYFTGLYVQWGSDGTLPNSVIRITGSAPHTFYKVGTFYPTQDPLTATVVVDSAASGVTVSSIIANRGTLLQGDAQQVLRSSPRLGLTIPLTWPASFRLTDSASGKDLLKFDPNSSRPALIGPNGVDMVGFSDAYTTERWRLVSSTGAARFASGKFQIEPTKGYVGMNTAPYLGVSMLIRPAVEGDRGIAVVRPSSTATNRLMEFQDETYNIQGMAIDSNGRPQAVGTPPRVAPGDQVTYANPNVQVRDIAGSIIAAVRPTPTAPGVICTVTFSRAYASVPLSVMLTDQSAYPSDLYVSARDVTSFTVSTRSALRGGSIVKFDYVVVA